MHLRFARHLVQALAVVIAFGAAGRTPAAAATLPTGFTEAQVAGGLASPTAMQFAPDGRLFVCEQGGRLRVIKNGALLATPFLTRHRGLSGRARPARRRLRSGVRARITSSTSITRRRRRPFTTASAASPRTATSPSGSEVVHPRSRQPQQRHEPQRRRARLRSRRQALRRGRRERQRRQRADAGQPARQDAAPQRRRQHPHRQPVLRQRRPDATARSGRSACATRSRSPFNPDGPEMFINDVGQNTWEEINDGLAGANYGWPETEGATSDPRFVSPRYAYNHSTGGCAITGGAFYSPLTRSFRPTTSATTSSRTTAAAGFGGSIRNAGNSVTTFASGIASPVDLKVGPTTAASTISRAAPARRPASCIASTYGAARADHHDAAGEPDRRGRRVGHLQRERVGRQRRCATSGSATAPTSPARPPRTTRSRRSRRPTTARGSARSSPTISAARPAPRPS